MKIALIGCGNWGKYILRDLLSLGAEVQVVARSTSSINNAKQLGINKIVNSISELDSPDGVVVATTIGSHYQVIKETLTLFPDAIIFCEKPLTDSQDHALDLLENYSNQVFVMDKWRYHKGIIKLRELYHSGKYGKLIGIATTRLSMSNPHQDADAVWVLLPHDLSIVYEILGFLPESRLAIAETHQQYFESLTAILGKDPWVHINVSARSTRRERRIELRFENHILVLKDGYASEIEIYGWDPVKQEIANEIEKIAFADEMPLLAELKSFLDYINKTGPTPKSSLAEATQVVKVITELMQMAKGMNTD